MRVEVEGRRREILGDAGSRNPSRSSVGEEEEEREEGEVLVERERGRGEEVGGGKERMRPEE